MARLIQCNKYRNRRWRILPMQILVVEDSLVQRQLLSSHLQEWGFPFTIAKDGSEAWTLLQRPDCPKLVLLDWVLPDIDGIELCRKIRLPGSRTSNSKCSDGLLHSTNQTKTSSPKLLSTKKPKKRKTGLTNCSAPSLRTVPI